jgi:hypothetical protein
VFAVGDGVRPVPTPCRIYLTGPDGKPVKPPGLPFWKDHFTCPGTVRLDLPPGEYAYEIERGPEFGRDSGTFTLEGPAESGGARPAGRTISIALPRIADLRAEGWWSGDLHIHRAPEEIALHLEAEDLAIGPVITWWNGKGRWTDHPIPGRLLQRHDGPRFAHLMAGEDERAGGALLYFNLPRPLPLLPSNSRNEHPSPMTYLAEARAVPGAHVDIEKPFWYDVPVWLASGQVDTMGLACNHMLRKAMHPNEAWGRARDLAKYPAPLGNGYYTQDLYYRALDAGLRVPPSAGSASGVMGNPVGYNRVYVHLDGGLDWDAWWEGLRAGRSFVTNGPLLRARADGRLPGHVFAAPAGQAVEIALEADLTAVDPVPALEIVRDGRVERTIPLDPAGLKGGGIRGRRLGTLTFRESGWFLVRAVADVPHTFRFASTAPFYVEIGGTRRASRSAARYFLDWVRERMERVKEEDPVKREEVLRHHREAERFWSERADRANAE